MFWSIYLYQTLLLCKASLRTLDSIQWLTRGELRLLEFCFQRVLLIFFQRDRCAHGGLPIKALPPGPPRTCGSLEPVWGIPALWATHECGWGKGWYLIRVRCPAWKEGGGYWTLFWLGKEQCVRRSIPVGEILCPPGTSLETKGKWSQSWWQPSWDVTIQ